MVRRVWRNWADWKFGQADRGREKKPTLLAHKKGRTGPRNGQRAAVRRLRPARTEVVAGFEACRIEVHRQLIVHDSLPPWPWPCPPPTQHGLSWWLVLMLVLVMMVMVMAVTAVAAAAAAAVMVTREGASQRGHTTAHRVGSSRQTGGATAGLYQHSTARRISVPCSWQSHLIELAALGVRHSEVVVRVRVGGAVGQRPLVVLPWVPQSSHNARSARVQVATSLPRCAIKARWNGWWCGFCCSHVT